VLNNCKYDTRVLKEAKTLAGAGHDVRIIALLDENTEAYEERDGFRIIRVTQTHIPRRFRQAIEKADSVFFSLIFQLPRWAYNLAKRTPGRHSYQVRQSQQVKPSHTSARSRPEQLMAVAYSGIGRGMYGLRRGLHVVAGIVLWVLGAPLMLGNYYRIWNAVKREPADVYHCHDLPTLPVGDAAKRRMGGKLVYDSHELFTQLHYAHGVRRLTFRALERHLVRRVDAVVTVNEFIAEWLSKRYGIALPVVVRNCPPLAAQSHEQRSGSLRKTLGLDDTVPIILHVGMFGRSRGSEKLILATPFVEHGVVVFLGWGAGGEEADLRELVRRKGLSERVLFARPVEPDKVVAHISSAQVGVIPFLNLSLNHYYVTPNKLWECMSAGLPVVGSNFPGLKAIVEGCRMGCTCDPEYPRDIADAINYVLSDTSRYTQMKKNALEAARIFSWENESAKLLEIYGRLSQRGHDRAN
jgi:glycosyltransferase involved in cell wall biosynthesis